MTRSASPDTDLLKRRLDIVATITQVNARQLRNRQILGGAEIEIAHLEMVLEQGHGTETDRNALAEARARQHDMNIAIDRCDGDLGALHDELAALDHKISGD